MATITANLALSNDTASSSVSVTQLMNLYKAGGTEGMDTMTSVSKILTSTNQVDLLTAASVSGTHHYVYISNPSTVASEYFNVGIGNAGGGTPTDTEELEDYMVVIGCLFLGRLIQTKILSLHLV